MGVGCLLQDRIAPSKILKVYMKHFFCGILISPDISKYQVKTLYTHPVYLECSENTLSVICPTESTISFCKIVIIKNLSKNKNFINQLRKDRLKKVIYTIAV